MAYDFTGVVSKYLSTATVPVTAPPFSMMCWGWQDVITSSKNTLLFLGQSTSDNHMYQLYTDNSSPPKLGFLSRDSSTWSGNLSSRTANLGQWNLYGLEVPTPTTSAKIWNSTGSENVNNAVTPTGLNVFAVGIAARLTPIQPFDGGIGEVAVWNVLLTAAEWAALQNKIDPRLIRPSALVYYRDLISDLNRPYGPGANLTNTGSVGVRTHVPMRYRHGHTVIGRAAPAAATPPAPTLSVAAYSPEAVTLTITSNGSGGSAITATQWEFRETLVGGAWSTGSAAGTLATKFLRGFATGVQYDFRVRFDNALGAGSYSTTQVLTMPELADQEAVAMIAWAQGLRSVPPYGVGTWSQEDHQQVLGMPTDPLMAASSAPIVTVPAPQTAFRVSTFMLGVSVADTGNDLATIRIQCTGGICTVTLTGTTVTVGSNGSADFTISGTQANLNTTIGSLLYTASAIGGQAITITGTDSGGLFDTKSFSVVVLNNIPVADAGGNQVVDYTATVQLDGSGSTDADGDTLTYAWSFVSKPPGSLAVFDNSQIVNPTFMPDAVGGEYVVQLIVRDGFNNSAPDTAIITVQGRSLVTYEHSDTVPAGAVIRSEPIHGSPAANGTEVFLVVSLGPELIPVPHVVEMTQAEAEETLARADMVLGTVTSVASTTIETGRVISQSPAEGTRVDQGTTVTLILSSGPALVPIPHTPALQEAEATEALDRAGF